MNTEHDDEGINFAIQVDDLWEYDYHNDDVDVQNVALTSADEVSALIRFVSAKKVPGCDHIPNRALKLLINKH